MLIPQQTIARRRILSLDKYHFDVDFLFAHKILINENHFLYSSELFAAAQLEKKAILIQLFQFLIESN